MTNTSMSKPWKRALLAVLLVGGLAGTLASTPAQARDDHRRHEEWRREEWRHHDSWRRHEAWRRHWEWEHSHRRPAVNLVLPLVR